MLKRLFIILATLAPLVCIASTGVVVTLSAACTSDSGDDGYYDSGPADDQKIAKDTKSGFDAIKKDGPLDDVLVDDQGTDQPYSPASSPSPWKYQQGWRLP